MAKILRFSVIGILISLSSSYTILTLNILAIPNASVTGKELLEQVIIAVLLGIMIGLISLIFEIESLNFSGQLFIHFIVVIICVLVAGYFGDWYDFAKKSTVVSLFISILVIYIITWGIILLLQKRDIEEINRIIQNRRKN